MESIWSERIYNEDGELMYEDNNGKEVMLLKLINNIFGSYKQRKGVARNTWYKLDVLVNINVNDCRPIITSKRFLDYEFSKIN